MCGATTGRTPRSRVGLVVVLTLVAGVLLAAAGLVASGPLGLVRPGPAPAVLGPLGPLGPVVPGGTVGSPVGDRGEVDVVVATPLSVADTARRSIVPLWLAVLGAAVLLLGAASRRATAPRSVATAPLGGSAPDRSRAPPVVRRSIS